MRAYSCAYERARARALVRTAAQGRARRCPCDFLWMRGARAAARRACAPAFARAFQRLVSHARVGLTPFVCVLVRAHAHMRVRASVCPCTRAWVNRCALVFAHLRVRVRSCVRAAGVVVCGALRWLATRPYAAHTLPPLVSISITKCPTAASSPSPTRTPYSLSFPHFLLLLHRLLLAAGDGNAGERNEQGGGF